MAKRDKYSVRNLKQQFPSNTACLEYLFDTLHSRACSCGGHYARITGRPQFQCSKCRFQISPMVGTIFQKSRTPLTLWFHALFIFSNAKSGISAKEMERQLGVTYKCAFRILSVIRKALPTKKPPLQGVVEYDESFFGGKGVAGKSNFHLGNVLDKKTAVMAAVERAGAVRASVVPNIRATTVGKFLDKHVSPAAKKLYTDSSSRFTHATYGYDRESVNHSKKEYARGRVHINSVESFFSHVKRSIKGTHKSVSPKYFQHYLDGFSWHWNNRDSDRARFQRLLQILPPAGGGRKRLGAD